MLDQSASAPARKKKFLKVIVVGDSSVGKTCLLSTFITGKTQESTSATIGAEFKNTMLKLKNGKDVKLQIWDTAG